MHNTAHRYGKDFFEVYSKNQGPLKIAEIGSKNVNGTLREHKPSNCVEYLGMDFEEGDGVDLILSDSYDFPLGDNTFDIVVTSSCLEHSEMFWLTFLEGMRILKPTGLMYCNAPSAWMPYHRYPIDCWRFWPDAAKGLQAWARRNKMQTQVLESFIGTLDPDILCLDWTAVFIKDIQYIDRYKDRMVDRMKPKEEFFNGYRYPSNDAFPSGWNELVGHFIQGQSPIPVLVEDKIHYIFRES